jgi:hypothetical protein
MDILSKSISPIFVIFFNKKKTIINTTLMLHVKKIDNENKNSNSRKKQNKKRKIKGYNVILEPSFDTN